MEYRKKNLKPKKNIVQVLQNAFEKEDFMYKLDFYGALRKLMFMNQNDHKIKAVKPCYITSEGMTIYLNDSLKQFIQLYERGRYHRKHLIEAFKRIDFGKDDMLTKRIVDVFLMELKKEEAKAKAQQQRMQSINNTEYSETNPSITTLTNVNDTWQEATIPELEEKAKKLAEVIGYNELKLLFQERAKVLLAEVRYDRNHKEGGIDTTSSRRKGSPGDALMTSSILMRSRILERTRKESNFQINQKQIVSSEVESSPQAGVLSEKSADAKSFTRVQSGVNLPILQTRQRANISATKESSNDDEFKHDFNKSPMRTGDDKTLQTTTASWHKDKTNHRGQHALISKLEKIESLGSQEASKTPRITPHFLGEEGIQDPLLQLDQSSIGPKPGQNQISQPPQRQETYITQNTSQKSPQCSMSRSIAGITNYNEEVKMTVFSQSDFSDLQSLTAKHIRGDQSESKQYRIISKINNYHNDLQERAQELDDQDSIATPKLMLQPTFSKQASQPVPYRGIQLQNT